MINCKNILFFFLTWILLNPGQLLSQDNDLIVLDQVIAVVGNDVVLQSDVENQVMQYQAQGIKSKNLHCEVVEEFLVQTLFLNQARIDSVVVDELQVESELERRLDYFINQIGSREKLEEYFDKTIIEIKEDFRKMIEDQLLTQKMQNQIIGEISVTPSEVDKYYKNLHVDSLPTIESKMEIRQIVKKPPYSEEAIREVRSRLLELRKRIIEGESFGTLALLYSEDPGSAQDKGELGYRNRKELVPEFAEAAFQLKEGGVSNIIETEFGYHIIQLIDRDGDRVNVRHILMKPKISRESRVKAINRLDSLSRLIRLDSMSFKTAAVKYSDDEKTRMNGGLMINPRSGNAKFTMEQLNKPDYFAVRELKEGEMSEPYQSFDDKGKPVFKIIQLKNRTKPHRANLEEDYDVIYEMAKAAKQERVISDWINEKQEEAYIHVDPRYKSCRFAHPGWYKE